MLVEWWSIPCPWMDQCGKFGEAWRHAKVSCPFCSVSTTTYCYMMSDVKSHVFDAVFPVGNPLDMGKLLELCIIFGEFQNKTRVISTTS